MHSAYYVAPKHNNYHGVQAKGPRDTRRGKAPAPFAARLVTLVRLPHILPFPAFPLSAGAVSGRSTDKRPRWAQIGRATPTLARFARLGRLTILQTAKHPPAPHACARTVNRVPPPPPDWKRHHETSPGSQFCCLCCYRVAGLCCSALSLTAGRPAEAEGRDSAGCW